MEPTNGKFSFWNGLGATSESRDTGLPEHQLTPDATIYAVASDLAEFHLQDIGLTVEWTDVPIPESQRSEVWKGVRRPYWNLPGYRLPIARWEHI